MYLDQVLLSRIKVKLPLTIEITWHWFNGLIRNVVFMLEIKLYFLPVAQPCSHILRSYSRLDVAEIMLYILNVLLTFALLEKVVPVVGDSRLPYT